MALTPFSSMFNDPFFGGGPLSVSRRTFPDEFSTLFDYGPLRSYFRDTQALANTAVDVRETPTEYQFVADLPGLKRDEVKVQIEDGNVLSLSGERTRESREDTDTYHRVERSTGKFMRRFRLPDNVDVDKVSATAEHGVLTVSVPKVQRQEQQRPAVKDVEVNEKK